MLPHEFIHQLYEKFVPTDEIVKARMRDKASMAWNRLYNSANDKNEKNERTKEYNLANSDQDGFAPKELIPLTIKEKICLMSGNWLLGYVFGFLYMAAVPFLQKLMTGQLSSSKDEEEDDQDDNDLELIMKYLKHKKSMQ